MQITQQQQPFSLDVRRCVVQLAVQGMSAKAISRQLGGHPCRATVQNIIRSWLATGEVRGRGRGRHACMHACMRAGRQAGRHARRMRVCSRRVRAQAGLAVRAARQP